MTTLLVDTNSLVEHLRPVIPTVKAIDILLLRLVYKAKMLHHPDNIVILRGVYTPPFNGCQLTGNVLKSIRESNTVIPNSVIISQDPEVLALSEYATAYRIADGLDDLEQVRFNKLKIEVGHDPRDYEWFREYGITEVSRGDKTRAGRGRADRWGWATSDGSNRTGQGNRLRRSADNVHVKVGRTGFQNYEVVQSVPDLLALLDQVDRVGWDTETTGLDTRRDKIVGESFSIDGVNGYYLPIMHRITGDFRNIPFEQVTEQVHPKLREKTMAGVNLSFDVLMTCRYGMGFPHKLEDVQGYAYMLGFHVPNPKNIGLKAMSKNELGDVMEEYKDVAEGGTFDEVPIEKAAPYAADDAVKSLALANLLRPRLTDAQRTRFDTIEMPFLRSVMRMTYNGMHLDQQALGPLIAEYNDELEHLVEDIRRHARVPDLNIASPMQLSRVLFEDLALPPTKRTKTGYSTSKPELEKIEYTHEIIPLIIRQRELSKLKSFLTTYPDYIADDGRIHSSLSPFFVISGRLNSRNPNLLNIPVRTEAGRRIRGLFTGQGDNELLSVDASQLEYRILAHMTGNEQLIEAFHDTSRDIHREMAVIAFDVPLEHVTPSMRSDAKNVVYAIIYGASAMRIAAMLNRPVSFGGLVLKRIKESIPEIEALREHIVGEARKHGYVESLLGHRSYIKNITSSSSQDRAHAERAAFDVVFQGTASGDVTKIATIETTKELDKYYDELNPTVALNLQVHDELILEGPQKELEQIQPHVESSFVNSVDLKVPLVAEGAIDKRWSDIH